MKAQHRLRWFLRINALVLLCAAPAVLLPYALMANISDWLQIGPFPNSPLVGYLTRSLSALYALLGLVTWFISGDLPRYSPLIRIWGWTTVGFAWVLLAVDWWVGLPLWWVWGEWSILLLDGWLMLHWQRAAFPLPMAEVAPPSIAEPSFIETENVS